MSRLRTDAVERKPVVRRTGRGPVLAPPTRLDRALPVQAGLLALLQRSAGNRAVADLIRARPPARPLVQRRTPRAPEARTNLVDGEVAADERIETTRVLLGLSRQEVYGAPGLGISRRTSVRLEHARNFFERGARAAEARFVFRARMVEADLDRLVGVMLDHPGRLAAVEWALERVGIARLAEAMANARGFGYDTTLTGAYYDAGVLPGTPIASILHVFTLGAPRANPVLVGVVARFLAAGASDDDARFALGTGLIDANLKRLLAVMLDHRGQRAAVDWALTRAGIARLAEAMANARGFGYDTTLTGAYYDAGVLPGTPIATILHVVSLGAPRANPVLVGVVARFMAAGASDDDARFALGTGLIDANLKRLLAVMLDHRGQRAAVDWALTRAGIARLAEAMANARGLGYDTTLTGAYYDAGVLPDTPIASILHAVSLGAPRSKPIRVSHVVAFLAGGAGDAEARFALSAAASDSDLEQMHRIMLGHLGQLAAVRWAVKRGGTDWAQVAADLKDARKFGYDTDLAEWARKTGQAQAEVVRDERAALINQDLGDQKKALGSALAVAEDELRKLKEAWSRKKWIYHPPTPPTGDDPGTPATGTVKKQKLGAEKVKERTTAETKVTVAGAAIDKAEDEANIRLAQAEAEKPNTAQAMVDLIAAYVHAGVAPVDAQALYAQLGNAGFRALYDTFGAGTGALVNTFGVPLLVVYLKARPATKVAPFVAHLTAGEIVKLHPGIDVVDALDMWDVFGVQFAPLIAFTKPIRLRRLLFDHRAPLVHLFKLSGGAATTALAAIGEGPFEWLLRDLKPADIVEFLAHGVPAPRLAEIGVPSCVNKFALGCAKDRTSLITLCNTAAITTPQIVTLINLCTVGSLTLARCVTALGLARNPTALVTILELQTRAGLSDTDVDAMLTAHAGVPAPAAGIEHDVYRRLAQRAQGELHLDGPGLQLLLSPANTQYPATITWIEDKKTGYDTGSGYSEMYNVSIPDPTTGNLRVYWQVHLHRKGGQTTSGSIKKWSQRYNTGPGVYRGVLPMDLENMVRATR